MKIKFFIVVFSALILLGSCGDERVRNNSIWYPQGGAGASFTGVANVLSLTPGTYVGVGGGGFYGDVHAQITTDATSILDIEIVYSHETPSFATPAFESLTNNIIARQSTGIDVFTGATFSSEAFLNAVEDALLQAGSNLDQMRAGGTRGGTSSAPVVSSDLPLSPGISYRTYSGSGFGYMDEVHISVRIEQRIAGIEITQSSETPAFANPAFEALTAKVIQAQTADVDIHTGATFTSEAFLEAVEEAIQQALQNR